MIITKANIRLSNSNKLHRKY